MARRNSGGVDPGLAILSFLLGTAGGIGAQSLEEKKQKKAIDKAMEIEENKRNIGLIMDAAKNPKATPQEISAANDLNKKYNILSPDLISSLYEGAHKRSVDQRQVEDLVRMKVGQQTQTMGGGAVSQPSLETSPVSSPQTPSLSRGPSAKGPNGKILNGYNLQNYAEDPKHFASVRDIYTKLPDFQSPEEIDSYIKTKYPQAPITGQMILNASQEHQVDPKLLTSLFEHESHFGTAGLATKTRNPGNVGGDSPSKDWYFPDWGQGVKATSSWLAKNRTGGKQGEQLAQASVPQIPQASLAPPPPGKYPLSVPSLGEDVMELHIKPGESPSITFKEPSRDQMSARALALQPPINQIKQLAAEDAQKAGMGQQHSTFKDELTGTLYNRTYDPVTNTTRISPVTPFPTELTPSQQSEEAARRAKMEEQQKILGRETPVNLSSGETLTVGDVSARQKAKELEAQRKVIVPVSPEQSLEFGKMIGAASDIGEGFIQATEALKQVNKGNFDITMLPTGLTESSFKALANRISSYTPDSMRYVNTIRDRLSGVATHTAELLFAMGGKNLTETEKNLVEDLRAGINLDPDIFVDRLLNGLNKVEKHAKGNIKYMEATNIDSRGVKVLLQEVQAAKENLLKMSPQGKRMLYGSKPEQSSSMLEDWSQVQ